MPTPDSPAAQTTDYTALKADLINVRAHNNRHLSPSDLAATRRQLETRLVEHGPATNHLDAGIDTQLAKRVEHLQTRAAALTTELERASKPKSRKRNPDGPELARRTLTNTRSELTVARAHLADHRAVTDQRPTTAGNRERTSMELNVIDQLIDRHADAATTQPAPYRSAALGPRPSEPKAAGRWDHAAASVERYRIGVLGQTPDSGPSAPAAKGVTHAIGPKPTNPADQHRWQHVTQTVAAINQHAPSPQLTSTLRRGR